MGGQTGGKNGAGTKTKRAQATLRIDKNEKSEQATGDR